LQITRPVNGAAGGGHAADVVGQFRLTVAKARTRSISCTPRRIQGSPRTDTLRWKPAASTRPRDGPAGWVSH